MGSTQSSIATQGPVSTQNTIKQKTTLHTHPLPLHRKRSTHHPTTAATTAATIATATAATTAATKTTTPSPAATTPSVTNTISVHGVCPDPSLMTRSQFNEQQCLQWFKEYTDPDSPQMMTPENTQQFFEDLGVSVEDVLTLVLAWKMETFTMGYITQEEWMNSMRRFETDALGKLKKKIPALRAMVKDPVQLKDIYRFTFGYAKNKGEKYMAVEVACVLWTMLLKDIYPLTNDFVTFVQETDSVRVINKDQWQSFFEFMVSVADTLTGYDETSAWPVLFDEFVAWKKHH